MEVTINTGTLNDKGVGIELVVLKSAKTMKSTLHEVKEMDLIATEGSKMRFSLDYKLNLSGTIVCFRMF